MKSRTSEAFPFGFLDIKFSLILMTRVKYNNTQSLQPVSLPSGKISLKQNNKAMSLALTLYKNILCVRHQAEPPELI